MVGTDTLAFFTLTGVLVLLSLSMPFFSAIFQNEVSVNDPSTLVDENQADLDFNTFASSMFRAFFWYYGELNIWANGFKFILNLTWLYLFVRLLRGGG